MEWGEVVVRWLGGDGGSLGVGGVLEWAPTQGGTETRRLQGAERAYEGAYTFGAYKQVGGQARSVNKSHQKSFQKRSPKTWILIPKGCQNGCKIDAQTHQKSIPKLVTAKIMNIIKFMFL